MLTRHLIEKRKDKKETAFFNVIDRKTGEVLGVEETNSSGAVIFHPHPTVQKAQERYEAGDQDEDPLASEIEGAALSKGIDPVTGKPIPASSPTGDTGSGGAGAGAGEGSGQPGTLFPANAPPIPTADKPGAASTTGGSAK